MKKNEGFFSGMPRFAVLRKTCFVPRAVCLIRTGEVDTPVRRAPVCRRNFRTVCLIATLVFLCSCAAKAQEAAVEADTAKVLAAAGISPLSRKVSPRDFFLPPAAAGAEQSLAGLKGKVVFLNFWATWCGPCRAEMPSMEALYGRYKERGLEILAVNCQENQADVLAFMKDNGLSFPAVLDSDGTVSASYGIRAIPTTFLLDREGMIIARVVGSIDWNTPEIQKALEFLLER